MLPHDLLQRQIAGSRKANPTTLVQIAMRIVRNINLVFNKSHAKKIGAFSRDLLKIDHRSIVAVRRIFFCSKSTP